MTVEAKASRAYRKQRRNTADYATELVERVTSAFRYAYSAWLYNVVKKSHKPVVTGPATSVRVHLHGVSTETTPLGAYVEVELAGAERDVDVYEADTGGGLTGYVFIVPGADITASFPPSRFQDVAFLIVNSELLDLVLPPEEEGRGVLFPWLKYPVARATVKLEANLNTVRSLGTVVLAYPYEEGEEYFFVETPDGIVATSGNPRLVLEDLVPRSELDVLVNHLRNLATSVERGMVSLGRLAVR